MRSPYVPTTALGLCILLCTAWAWAEPPPTASPVPAGVPNASGEPPSFPVAQDPVLQGPPAGALAGLSLDADAAPLALSVAQALQMGMEANLTLGAARYLAPIAHAYWEAAEGGFDTLLTAGFSIAHAEEPTALLIFGADKVKTDSVGWSAGATRALRSGGSVSLMYRADRFDTDSPFAAINPYWTPGLGVEMSKPLLRGAGDVAMADVRRAQNDHVAARAAYTSTAEDIALSIVLAYWELAFAEANLGARRKSESVAGELLSDELARLAAEVATPLEVAEARAGLERRLSERLASENFRDGAQDALLALIQPFGARRHFGRRIELTDSVAAQPPRVPTAQDIEQLVGLALRGRPELTNSRARIANRGIDTTVAYNAIQPQLDLNARVASDGLGDGADSHGDMLGGDAVSGSLGLEFSIFVGQRSAKARWRATGWARRQALILHQELENRIVLEVRTALRDVLTAAAQIRAGESEVQAAQADLDGEQLKREQGKSTPYNVLQKEDDHTQAVARLARARADRHQSLARMWRAVGGLADAVGAQVPQWPPCSTCR